LRRSIEMTNEAKSGHPTSACSAAEIMAVLFFDEMRYSIEAPKDPSADRFVMSKVGVPCLAIEESLRGTPVRFSTPHGTRPASSRARRS